jgi:hypothetical protein
MATPRAIPVSRSSLRCGEFVDEYAVSAVSNAVFSPLRLTHERVKTGDSAFTARRPTKAPSFVASCSPHLGEVPVKPARSAPPKAAEGP